MNTKGKILIGNDRSGMLQFSCQVLEEQGYEVICIDDALQILETVRSNLPELVLLNSRQVGGLEICRTIRACADLQDVWVVLLLDELTGMGIREAGVEAGVNDYLVWPIDKSSVLMRVEAIIERRKNEISIRQREEKLAQRLSELSAFQVIGMQIYQLHSVDEILSAAMDEIFKAFHPDRVNVCLLEDGILQVKASRTAWDKQPDHTLPIACEDGCICKQVLQDGKSWFSIDAKVDRGCVLMQGRADDLISVAVLPLQMGPEPFGVVGLSGVNGQVFEQYAPILRAFFAQLSAGIYNARLVETVQKELSERKQLDQILQNKNKVLAALQETTLELISELDLQTLLENIVQRAGQLMDTDSGFINLVQAGSRVLQQTVGSGVLAEKLVKPPLQGEGLTGIVWQSGEPLVVDDYDNWPGRLPDFKKGLMRTLAGVPLMKNGQVIGVLGMAYRSGSKGTFGAEELDLLVQFARLASIAISNAQIFSTLQKELGERKRAEQALREREFWLRESQRVGQIGSFVLDLDTGKWFCSDVLDDILGIESYSEKNMLSWIRLIHADMRSEMVRFFNQNIRESTGTFSQEYKIVNAKTGEEHWVLGHGKLLVSETGVPFRMFGTIQDVTVRKLAEDQIKKLNLQLEQRVEERTLQLQRMNKELEAFSYSVSHDLRAPLRGIDGWSQALEEDYSSQLDERGLSYLTRVRDETGRMGRLIDDLLNLAQFSFGELKLKRVDISELAKRIADRLLEPLGGYPIEFDIQPGMAAECDENLLEIAMTNLLSNALKFTSKREHARVELGQIDQEGQSVYFVRDNGAGFNLAFAKNLFGAFQRFHRQSEFSGNGVGLATVQRIIHRHGGRIWADSVPDVGTVFYFSLAA